jgi:hypothetical protein
MLLEGQVSGQAGAMMIHIGSLAEQSCNADTLNNTFFEPRTSSWHVFHQLSWPSGQYPREVRRQTLPSSPEPPAYYPVHTG